jgi:hypothetical protein
MNSVVGTHHTAKPYPVQQPNYSWTRQRQRCLINVQGERNEEQNKTSYKPRISTGPHSTDSSLKSLNNTS